LAEYRVIVGDCITGMATLPAGSVHCCVSSPPYWGLRQYLFDKAVVPRYNLSHEERTFLHEELARRGIKPRC
jgi:DNA modification methylase